MFKYNNINGLLTKSVLVLVDSKFNFTQKTKTKTK